MSDHMAATEPQSPQSYANQWLCQQTLELEYQALKLRSAKMVDPVAERAVTVMDLSRFQFVKPTPKTLCRPPTPTHKRGGSLFSAGAPPEDPNFSLRSFLVADPVEDSNALYARIAVKGGRVTPGDVPPLPPPKREEGSCKADRGLE